jgi:hypothetical protein
MLRVTVDNFQSIEHVEVKVDGFAALVGRSNIGKSALVRAVRYALTGTLGSDFVRHDPDTCTRIKRGTKKCKCQCNVRIEIKGHMTILWEKGDAVNQYTVWDAEGNKQVYNKVERGNLTFLGEGFETIKVGNDKNVMVQIANQFKPLFLVDESGSVVADVLSDVAKLDDLNEALRMVEKDRRAAVSERKVRERDLASQQEVLDTYDGLDDDIGRVAQLRGEGDKLVEANDELDRLSGFLSQLEEYAVAIRSLRSAVKPALPASQSLQEAFQGALDLRRFERDYDALTGQVSALTAAVKPALSAPPREQLDSLASLRGWEKRRSVLGPLVELLEGVCLVDLPSPEGIRQADDELELLTKWLGRLRQLKVAFLAVRDAVAVELPDQPQLQAHYQKFIWLCEIETRRDALVSEVESLRTAHAEAEREVQSLLQEFAELGACPTCEQKLDPSHRLH